MKIEIKQSLVKVNSLKISRPELDLLFILFRLLII